MLEECHFTFYFAAFFCHKDSLTAGQLICPRPAKVRKLIDQNKNERMWAQLCNPVKVKNEI
jgi:hypothetical protein